MSLECYWCVANKPAYGNQLGTKGAPFACCHRCQIFTCGHHGQRDDGIQKFFCFDCDKTILIESAVSLADPQTVTVNEIYSRIGNFVTRVVVDDLFKSLEDFKRRRAGYLFFLYQIEEGYIDYDNWPDGILKTEIRNFPYDAQKLLVAAAILIADTDSLEDLERRGNQLFLNLKTSVKVPAYG